MASQRLETIAHPRSGTEITGYRLQPGDTIRSTDVYDSTNGRWDAAPCPGLTLGEGTATVWVRPEGASSIDDVQC
jgi:hypothetical protein